jgi:hypothetical protein
VASHNNVFTTIFFCFFVIYFLYELEASKFNNYLSDELGRQIELMNSISFEKLEVSQILLVAKVLPCVE